MNSIFQLTSINNFKIIKLSPLQQQLTSQGVLMIPFLILKEAAVMSSNPTIRGRSGTHQGSSISSASLSYSVSDPDESVESWGLRTGMEAVDIFFSMGLIFFSNQFSFNRKISLSGWMCVCVDIQVTTERLNNGHPRLFFSSNKSWPKKLESRGNDHRRRWGAFNVKNKFFLMRNKTI